MTLATRPVSAPPVAALSGCVVALVIYEAVMTGSHTALRAARLPKF